MRVLYFGFFRERAMTEVFAMIDADFVMSLLAATLAA